MKKERGTMQDRGGMEEVADGCAAFLAARIAQELHDYDPDRGNLRAVGQVAPMSADWHRLLLREFREALIEPVEIEYLAAGGLVRRCWAVTRPGSAYRVIWIPSAELFSLAVESKFGPVDIGVHGDAISVFGSIH